MARSSSPGLPLARSMRSLDGTSSAVITATTPLSARATSTSISVIRADVIVERTILPYCAGQMPVGGVEHGSLHLVDEVMVCRPLTHDVHGRTSALVCPDEPRVKVSVEWSFMVELRPPAAVSAIAAPPITMRPQARSAWRRNPQRRRGSWFSLRLNPHAAVPSLSEHELEGLLGHGPELFDQAS